jgi:hypothetical protein
LGVLLNTSPLSGIFLSFWALQKNLFLLVWNRERVSALAWSVLRTKIGTSSTNFGMKPLLNTHMLHHKLKRKHKHSFHCANCFVRHCENLYRILALEVFFAVFLLNILHVDIPYYQHKIKGFW